MPLPPQANLNTPMHCTHHTAGDYQSPISASLNAHRVSNNCISDQCTQNSGNCWVLRKGLHELTKATGRQFQRGLLHPTADLIA